MGRVARKAYSILLVAWLILALGLVASIRPAKAQVSLVEFYVDQPLGYIPYATPGVSQAVVIPIKIETSGIPDYVAGGIAGWGLNLRVDPNVLDINTTGCAPPKCIPPIPANGTAVQGTFMPTYASWFPPTGTLFAVGSADPLTGYWANIADALNPNPGHGAGDGFIGMGYDLLVTIKVTSKVNQPCLIDIVSGYYKLGDGSVYAADILVDGYYGTPPPSYLSSTGPFDPTMPIGSTWHELYPHYCNNLILTSWEDNGDDYLSASDQIDMTNETDGWIYWFHVDAVTVTIHWTFKEGPEGPPTGELGDGEPSVPIEATEELPPPVCTYWHQIYPDYCREFHITSWIDNDGSGTFNPSDQFDFEYMDEPGVTYWAHLDSVTTDIILTFKEKEPPVPEFPLGAAVEIGLIVAVAYIWWTRRRKLEGAL